MNIGQKIKRIRNLRGITQKELGMKIGFNEANADVRIAQYESGNRTPKKELKDAISQVLNINPQYLTDHSIDSIESVIFALIDIEDAIGLSIRLIDGAPCLFINAELSEFLIEWYIMKYNFSKSIITNEEYLNWKYNISPKNMKGRNE